jgi:Fe-S-cluster-containing dehydrogenase component
MAGGVPRISFAYFHCFHCDDPACVDACPTGAMVMREEDGIVYVDESECIGCLACVEACPWSVPRLNEETGKVVKCDYCMDRVDRGLKPACVAKCLTRCLHFGKADELKGLKGDRYAEVLPYEAAPQEGA